MNWLLDRIVSAEFRSGEMLPREVDLANEMSVSRGVVREVVRALEERGVLSVRHGRGATVAPRERWSALDPDVSRALLYGPDGRRFLIELTESRLMMEPGAARLAASRIDGASSDSLAEAMQRFEAARAADAVTRGVVELEVHRTVALACGNRPLGRILLDVLASLEPAVPVLGRWKTSAQEHEHLVTAIRAGDAEGAGTAMTAHLDALLGALRRGRLPLLPATPRTFARS